MLFSIVRIQTRSDVFELKARLNRAVGTDPEEPLALYYLITHTYIGRGRSIPLNPLKFISSTIGKIDEDALIRVNCSLALFLGLAQQTPLIFG